MHRRVRTLIGQPSGYDERRVLERARLGGNVRLVIGNGAAVPSRSGQLIDLSESGCQLRVYKPVLADVDGRVEMHVGATLVSIDVTIRWVREESTTWRVGCEFVPGAPRDEAVLRK